MRSTAGDGLRPLKQRATRKVKNQMITPDQFKRDVLAWAKKIGVETREIHLRKMKRKWASCSSKGRLTFDTALLKEPNEKRLEILLHELLHLRYPNHGKMFNRLLESYLRKNP